MTACNQRPHAGVLARAVLALTLGLVALVAPAATVEAATVPVVSSLSPASGLSTGGTVVTITGTGFTGATNLTIGNRRPLSYTIDTPTQITAVTPFRRAPGTVNIRITGPGGTSPITPPSLQRGSRPSPDGTAPHKTDDGPNLGAEERGAGDHPLLTGVRAPHTVGVVEHRARAGPPCRYR